MAMEPDDLHDDGEDHFAEYSLHPYGGGYDIALTYGKPLPLSPAICYPIATAATTPLPPYPPPSQPSVPPPSAGAAPKDSPPPPPTDPGSYWNGHTDLFGFWYVGARCRGTPESWQWTADYLFGYLPFHGSKRHDSHNFGNLNYAYEKCHPLSPISVQMDTFTRTIEDNKGYGFTECYQEEETVLTDLFQVNCHAHESHRLSPLVSYEMDPNADGRLVGDGFGWWPVDSGGAEYIQEKASTELEYFCGSEKLDRSMSLTLGCEDLNYQDIYQDEVCKFDQRNCGYKSYTSELPMSVEVDPAEQGSSYELNCSKDFVEQLFCNGREDSLYTNHSYKELRSAEIEPFAQVQPWDSREFYQQNTHWESEQGNAYTMECSGRSYWPF